MVDTGLQGNNIQKMKSPRQYVFEGMEVLPEALVPFVTKRLESALTGHWQIQVTKKLRLHRVRNGSITWDQIALLKTIDQFWTEAFRTILGRSERSIVNELIDVRNKLAHSGEFTYDDAERALDSMRRLMEAINASEQALQIGKMRNEILRDKFATDSGASRTRTRPGLGQTHSVETSSGYNNSQRSPASRTDFETELHTQLHRAQTQGRSFLEVNSGDLHRQIGGYPGGKHRMSTCCNVMYAEMESDDTVVSAPPKGKGASLTIRYQLPRKAV